MTQPTPRLGRFSATFLLVASGVMALTSLGAGAATALLASQSGGSAVTLPLSVGEDVTAPAESRLGTARLVVYAHTEGVQGSAAAALQCTATSPGGTRRVLGGAALNRPPDVVAEGVTLTAVHVVSGWKPRDVIRCEGPRVAALAPLLLVVDSGVPPTALAVGALLAVAAAGASLLTFVLARGLRRRGAAGWPPPPYGPTMGRESGQPNSR